jgi:hypothetical protein
MYISLVRVLIGVAFLCACGFSQPRDVSSDALTDGTSSRDAVSASENARRAYLGLQASIAKSISLGFDGFNVATTATLPPQTAGGAVGGTLTLTGQIDVGASPNKNMRLYVGMADYTDGNIAINGSGDTIQVKYDTNVDPTKQPYLELKLLNIPTGTMTGTLTSGTTLMGFYNPTGAIIGDVELDLTFNGTLMDPGNGTVRRVAGSSHVTGTVKLGDGVYNVDLTI